MKRRLIVILSVVGLIAACNSSSDSENHKETKSISHSTVNKSTSTEQNIDLDTISNGYLQNKVFELGANSHFTDSCAFYFACDCCLSELIFNRDSSFYCIDYCMSDQTVFFGNYTLEERTLILSHNGIKISKLYNWENEMDTSAIDYFMKDTVVQMHSTTYTLTLCNNKLKLESINKKFSAIETKSRPFKTSKFLEKEGFFDRYHKIEDSLNENIDDTYAKSFVLIVDTNKNYNALRDLMLRLSKQLNLEIDTMGRVYDAEKNLISLADSIKDELYAGEYFPRRFQEEFLSLEYLDSYQRSTKNKTIALVAGIYSSKESADSTLQNILLLDSSAFVIESDIYLGCMH